MEIKLRPLFLFSLSSLTHTLELSIAPTFYAQLFQISMMSASFMYLQLGFVIFCQKEISAKAVHKMLVKLTSARLFCTKNIFFSIPAHTLAMIAFLQNVRAFSRLTKHDLDWNQSESYFVARKDVFWWRQFLSTNNNNQNRNEKSLGSNKAVVCAEQRRLIKK